MEDSLPSVTRLLQSWQQGDERAREELFLVIYDKLHQIARNQMRGQPPGHILQTTALIHEAYLKLAGEEQREWQNRKHFFAVAAAAMRQVLVDYARRKSSLKEGGDRLRVDFEETTTVIAERASEIIQLDDALNALASQDMRKARIVEMQFFGGLTQEEISEVLNISVPTIKRDLRLAKAWLQRQLSTSKGL